MGDGDIDVLANTRYNNLSWFENIDGQGNFGNEKIISTDLYQTSDILTIDIDNDGDLDVFAANSSDHKVAWYKNLDGTGNFGPQNVINNSGTTFIYALDINGDGFVDILSQNGSTRWFENDGTGNFGSAHIIIDDFVEFLSPVDIDADGDIDIIIEDFNQISWYENIDGEGNYSSKQTLIPNIYYPKDIGVNDIDDDGDLDLIIRKYPSSTDYHIVWYENIGGVFSEEKAISTNDMKISLFDLNQDGHTDIIAQDNNRII